MLANLGSRDRLLRLVIASTMFWIVALGLAKGLWIVIPSSIATMMIMTSSSGHCPVYRFFGWSTRMRARLRA